MIQITNCRQNQCSRQYVLNSKGVQVQAY
jgi:hypothetical protein